MNIHIRTYTSKDCLLLAQLFYDTVHTVNARDYTPEQLQAWAPGLPDLEQWDRSFLEHTTFVAEAQGRGIATALCDALERSAGEAERIVTHASLTAKPFFLSRGYRVKKEQQVERNGTLLTNYVMELRKDGRPENRKL